ncbi:MAG: peptidase U32 family protein [Pseudomonadota bacterium]
MNILAPIDKVDDVEDVIKAGANELYCGVIWDKWLSRYTIAAINRRPATICNLQSFNALEEAVSIAHSYNALVNLAINEHFYTQDQYPMLLDYIKKAIDAGVDSFIVADLNLILAIKDAGLETSINVSTGISIFNSETVKFLQKLGIDKVIFERHLTIDEIRDIVKNVTGVETCVFIFNSRCPNVDGLCTFDHVQSLESSFKNSCMLPYSLSLYSDKPANRKSKSAIAHSNKAEIAFKRQQVWTRLHMDDVPCGACALYDFVEMGVDCVKIVGRGNDLKRKINDVKFIRMLLTLLQDKTISRKQYIEQTRAFYKYVYRLPCRTAMCYYPEVREA